MVVEEIFDAERELLQSLWEIVDWEISIAITLDLHANVAEKICQNVNIIISCKTYPHVDIREATNHAGNLLEQAMSMGKSIKTIMR